MLTLNIVTRIVEKVRWTRMNIIVITHHVKRINNESFHINMMTLMVILDILAALLVFMENSGS
jgi:hypothetical protein